MILPRYLDRSGDFTPLKVNDLSCIEYRSRQSVRQTRMLLTTTLLVAVLKGEKVVHTEDGDMIISEGSCFLARKGAYLFSENLGRDKEYHTLVFFLDQGFLADFLKTLPGREPDNATAQGPPIFEIPMTPLLRASVLSFLPYFVHQSPSQSDLMGLKLREMLLNLIDADQSRHFLSFLWETWSQRKQSLTRIMEDYYTEPVTLKELADLSGRSLSSFKRDFSRTFGATPRQWINQRRLSLAKSLMLHDGRNVSQACFEVGFENVSHFSRLFKKTYGYSPGTLKSKAAV